MAFPPLFNKPKTTKPSHPFSNPAVCLAPPDLQSSFSGHQIISISCQPCLLPSPPQVCHEFWLSNSSARVPLRISYDPIMGFHAYVWSRVDSPNPFSGFPAPEPPVEPCPGFLVLGWWPGLVPLTQAILGSARKLCFPAAHPSPTPSFSPGLPVCAMERIL